MGLVQKYRHHVVESRGALRNIGITLYILLYFKHGIVVKRRKRLSAPRSQQPPLRQVLPTTQEQDPRWNHWPDPLSFPLWIQQRAPSLFLGVIQPIIQIQSRL